MQLAPRLKLPAVALAAAPIYAGRFGGPLVFLAFILTVNT